MTVKSVWILNYYSESSLDFELMAVNLVKIKTTFFIIFARYFKKIKKWEYDHYQNKKTI